MSSMPPYTLLVEVNASGLYSPNAPAAANRVMCYPPKHPIRPMKQWFRSSVTPMAAGRLERFPPFAIISQKIFDLPRCGPSSPSGSASCVRRLACRRCATPLFGGTPRFLIALARENFSSARFELFYRNIRWSTPSSIGRAVQSFAVDTHARGNDQSADRSF